MDDKGFKTHERTLTADSIDSIDSIEEGPPIPGRPPPPPPPANFWRRWWLENSIGYRYGVFLSFACSVIVLLINIILLLVSLFLRGSTIGDTSSQRILYEGSCDKAKRGNVALHFAINALSTIILASSSYCMQCLAAPTREEVDNAHSTERWLDIGVPGFRNLRYIGKKRATLWALLGISSLPLHLL
jgi:hypothetical protein